MIPRWRRLWRRQGSGIHLRQFAGAQYRRSVGKSTQPLPRMDGTANVSTKVDRMFCQTEPCAESPTGLKDAAGGDSSAKSETRWFYRCTTALNAVAAEGGPGESHVTWSIRIQILGRNMKFNRFATSLISFGVLALGSMQPSNADEAALAASASVQNGGELQEVIVTARNRRNRSSTCR